LFFSHQTSSPLYRSTPPSLCHPVLYVPGLSCQVCQVCHLLVPDATLPWSYCTPPNLIAPLPSPDPGLPLRLLDLLDLVCLLLSTPPRTTTPTTTTSQLCRATRIPPTLACATFASVCRLLLVLLVLLLLLLFPPPTTTTTTILDLPTSFYFPQNHLDQRLHLGQSTAPAIPQDLCSAHS
jgi:hypothetical protein